MSDTIKKELETMNLLEESEDLAIGAGAVSVGKIDNIGTIISSAMPPVAHLTVMTIKSNCNIILTKNLSCRTKITL